MTNITHLHPTNPDAAARLIASVPQPKGDFDRDGMIANLPTILEGALEYLLCDIEVQGSSEPSAVGCRIIAAVIARLKS